ncbi:phosphatidylserine decarboxylase [Thalassoroseus pseudoceratinae]|uniref:phosphatidylserine decarboxylase n=1 Tax=Thalassoroseus pseudoceratinae TaxID=2713176 RepID=UPI0014200F30|nr:phosphatidylserine decarboxylase [Thalassoroseus pseudoceratinae]
MQHQYIDRETGEVRTEKLYHDRMVRMLYSRYRENASLMCRALASRRMTHLLGFLNYQFRVGSYLTGSQRFAKELGIDVAECVEAPESLNTAKKWFQRQIRYWETRPMPEEADAVVSPADARTLVGSFANGSPIRLKDKFFSLDELLGNRDHNWRLHFEGGDLAVFRLTPDKYHYNHVPVSGIVRDIYTLDGSYHSCNPSAVVSIVTPYSKNRRVVTIIDTDVPGGTGIGLVAMIEVVALMIGGITQCYSSKRYDQPQNVSAGMFVRRGQPKSLYEPGSSTDVLLFEPKRIRFATDLVRNMSRGLDSRFSEGFGQPLVETDVRVRSLIATAKTPQIQEPVINFDLPNTPPSKAEIF